MPDLLAYNRSHYALVEAKATTSRAPSTLREKHLYQFLVDVKTRSDLFHYTYEAYLICAHFMDGGRVACTILHLDLGVGSLGAVPPDIQQSWHPTLPADDQPDERLDTYLRFGAVGSAGWRSLPCRSTHDEATRCGVLVLLVRSRGDDVVAPQVERFLEARMRELNVLQDWESMYERLPDLRHRRRAILVRAAKRLKSRKRELEWE